jgi:hypothetical protein
VKEVKFGQVTRIDLGTRAHTCQLELGNLRGRLLRYLIHISFHVVTEMGKDEDGNIVIVKDEQTMCDAWLWESGVGLRYT